MQTKIFGYLQVVYIDDDGNATVILSEVKYGKIVIITDYFGYYGVIGKVKAAVPSTPATDNTAPVLPLALLVLVLGAGLVILVERRKTLKQLKT